MEQKYLMDTNAVIDYLNNKLPDSSANLIDSITAQISVITSMELLSWQKSTSEQLKVLQYFIDGDTVIGLEESIILKTIELRKQYKIKLPDSIIAATAIANKMDLISHNIDDFINIPEINVIDPWNVKRR
jgi:predicted nucleic acid-binding protein